MIDDNERRIAQKTSYIFLETEVGDRCRNTLNNCGYVDENSILTALLVVWERAIEIADGKGSDALSHARAVATLMISDPSAARALIRDRLPVRCCYCDGTSELRTRDCEIICGGCDERYD